METVEIREQRADSHSFHKPAEKTLAAGCTKTPAGLREKTRVSDGEKPFAKERKSEESQKTKTGQFTY